LAPEDERAVWGNPPFGEMAAGSYGKSAELTNLGLTHFVLALVRGHTVFESPFQCSDGFHVIHLVYRLFCAEVACPPSFGRVL